MTIRPYHENDYDALIALFILNCPIYFAVGEVGHFREYLKKRLDLYYVVREGELIIGGGGINRYKDQQLGSLSWAFLHPDFHNKGIGSMLLHYRLAILKDDQTIKKIRVLTSQVVFTFFEKNGFEVIDIKKNFWAEGLDYYEMIYS